MPLAQMEITVLLKYIFLNLPKMFFQGAFLTNQQQCSFLAPVDLFAVLRVVKVSNPEEKSPGCFTHDIWNIYHS